MLDAGKQTKNVNLIKVIITSLQIVPDSMKVIFLRGNLNRNDHRNNKNMPKEAHWWASI